MKTMNVLSINPSTDIINHTDFISRYGLRSYNLWKLIKLSNEIGYSVPKSVLIDCSLSQELYKSVGSLLKEKTASEKYTLSSYLLMQSYTDYLSLKHQDIVEIAMDIDSGNSPIIRGTSCAEGYKNLSFAGVCHSSIPKSNLSIETNTYNGTAKVLSSVFSPYAQYYFKVHGIPRSKTDVGIIMMEMIDTPLYHATAYVYPSEIRIKYFFTPQTGTIYKGGGDIVVTTSNEDLVINSEFGNYSKIWHQVIEVLKKLPKSIYGTGFPVDVEFLISEDQGFCKINIVQIRPLSRIHFDNYSKSKNDSAMNLSYGSKTIPESHLYHSFGNFFGEINVVENEIKNQQSMIPQIYVVKHDLGDGLFSFLKKISTKEKVGLIVTHPKDRSHDHLQYSVYEDPRLSFVIHVEEKFTSELKDGMIVNIMSNGKIANISETTEITLDDINISFIKQDNLDLVKEKISAVFLVGFINNGNIVTTLNERGWDIPGGHVEQTDSSLLEALKRETIEESGVTLVNAIPYALIRFKGSESQMLFYASNNCTSGKFTPSNDALDRKFMTIEEFIAVYYWKKDLMELLIKKAIEILR